MTVKTIDEQIASARARHERYVLNKGQPLRPKMHRLVGAQYKRCSPYEKMLSPILRLANGKRSIPEIAAKLGLTRGVVNTCIQVLKRRGEKPIFKSSKGGRPA